MDTNYSESLVRRLSVAALYLKIRNDATSSAFYNKIQINYATALSVSTKGLFLFISAKALLITLHLRALRTYFTPVMAGMVGVKKYAYDICGDTVNIASRMESTGGPGKVNISGITYEFVKAKFTCVRK